MLRAESIPIFRGEVGLSDGNYAVKISEKISPDSL
jgi:flagellar motor switch protein FliM